MIKKILITIIILGVGIFLVSAISKENKTTNHEELETAEQEAMETQEQEDTETNVMSENTDSQNTTQTNTPETSTSNPATFILTDVAAHSREADCYTAIDGVVYDLTAWIHKHPGGDRNILRICGIDGTQAYNGQHGNDTKANNILAGYEVGILAN